MYSVLVLFLLLHCFIFILVLLLCCVYRSSLYCSILSDLCTLCLSCYYLYIVLSLYLYCRYVVYPDHHFTVIYLQTCVLCVCLVITSTLFYLHTCIVVMLCIPIITLLQYIFRLVYSVFVLLLLLHCFILYLYCCYVVYPDHHFTVIYIQTCVLCVCLVITSTLFYLYTCTVVMLCIQIITLVYYTFRLVYSVLVLFLLLHCFIFILVLLLCCVSRSSLYCNIPSDLCTLCLSCYYFYIVLSLYLYCWYVVYTDHHFSVIYLQTCVLCACLVFTSTLFYLYTCTVVMLCI